MNARQPSTTAFEQRGRQADGRQVLLVGQSPLTIAGLRAILSEGGDEVLGTGVRLDQLTDLIAAASVVILLNEADLEELDTAGFPDRPAALVVSSQWPSFLPRQRPWGVIPTDSTPGEIRAALTALDAGLCVLPPAMLAQIGKPVSMAGEGPATDEPLTAREREVLQLLAEGLTNRQIALRLVISEHTVKFHISSIYTKLGVASRTEAVRTGARSGLVVW